MEIHFGKELTAGIRSAGGYGYVGSNVRQRLTGYERDNETGLDFSQSRYYSNIQGRFTGVDPFNPIFEKQGSAFVGWISEPQRWNKYSYALNNPLRYVDEDGENPLEAIKKGARNIAKLSAEIAKRSGGRVTHPLIMAAEVLHKALQFAFPSIVVETGGLQYAHEATGARLASAFEGKSFKGVSNQERPGIDGLLYEGSLSSMRNVEPVQLQNNGPSNDVIGNIARGADGHEGSVKDAGRQGVHLFVTVTDPKTTVSQVLGSIQANANTGTGIVNMTTRQYIPKVTIVTSDGAVRVQNGKVYSCDDKGKCTAQ